MTRKAGLFLILLISFAFTFESALRLGPVPEALPKLDTVKTTLTWPSIVQAHYDLFTWSYIYDSDTNEVARQIPCSTFGSIYQWWDITDSTRNVVGFRNPLVYNAIAKSFYRSPQVRMALYKWIRPSYLAAYKTFPQWKKNIYVNMLAHAKTYLATFDYKGELKAFNSNQDFDAYGAHGRRGDFHRMETWIFRRVHNQEMTIREMQQWVTIFEKDLREARAE